MSDTQQDTSVDAVTAEPITPNDPVAVVTDNRVTAAAEPIATETQSSSVAPNKPESPVMVGQTTGASRSMTAPLLSTEAAWDGSTGPVDNPNVHLTMEYTTAPLALEDNKEISRDHEVLPFLAERSPEVDQRIRALVSPMALNTGKGQDWNQGLIAARGYTAYLDRRFEDTVRSADAKFMQFLDTEAGKLGFTAPRVAEAGASGYTGEKGLMRVRAIMGLGGIVAVPLWHSGFWITLTAPPDSAIIELQRRLQEEKIELGRETFGLVFTNEQSYINSWLLDFCFDHIYETSVRVDNNLDLRRLIKIQDLNILFWGLACLIWPRGFDYVRSLTTVEGIENTQTISGKIKVSKLMWVDNASFDAKHRAHMTNRQRGKMTIEQVEDYQKSFVPTLAAGRRVTIREGLDVLIAAPDVESYIADGENWIAGLVQIVDSTFTQAAPTQDERNRMIDMHSRATRLRNNGSWIKALYIDDVENTNREDISETLNVLSMDDEASELLETAVRKFKDDCTRALIAIPETSGKDTGLPRFPHLIPIDVVNTFFTLLAQRVAIISRR